MGRVLATAEGRTDVMVKFLDSGSTTNLTASFKMDLPTRAGQGGLAISPDGSQIAFSARSDPTGGYDIWTIPGPVGGSPRKTDQYNQRRPVVAGWQAAVVPIAGSTTGDGLGVSASDGTGQRILVPREGGRHIHWPAWSRDGKHLLHIYLRRLAHRGPPTPIGSAVSGGKPEPVVRSVRRAIYPVPLPGGALLFSGNPTSLELGLWWQAAPEAPPMPLTNGVGEHIESRTSGDGKRVVTTLLDVRQSLVAITAGPGLASGWTALTDGHTGDLFVGGLSERADRVQFLAVRPSQSVAC